MNLAITLTTIILSIPMFTSAQEQIKIEFEPIQILKTSYSTNYLQVNDINGDGFNDIAVINNAKSCIDIFLRKRDQYTQLDSDKILDNDINALSDSSKYIKKELLMPIQMSSLILTDLNQDGKSDIAFCGDEKYLFIINQSKDSNDPFELKWDNRKRIKIDDTIPPGYRLLAEDLNQDSKTDLILTGKKYSHFFKMGTNGEFEKPITFPLLEGYLGNAISDINNDGLMDILEINSNSDYPIMIRFAQAKGQWGPLIDFFIEKPAALKVSNNNNITSIASIESKSGRLSIYKLSDEDEFEIDSNVLIYPLTSGNSRARLLAICDINDDNLDDLCITEPDSAEITCYFQNKEGVFTDYQKFPSLAEISRIQPVANDKNYLAVMSKKEKAIGISYFKDGHLSFPELLRIDNEPLDFEVSDINLDGKFDIIALLKNAENGIKVDAFLANNTGFDSPITLYKTDKDFSATDIIAYQSSPNHSCDIIISPNFREPLYLQRKSEKLEWLSVNLANQRMLKEIIKNNYTLASIVENNESFLSATNSYVRQFGVEKSEWKIKRQYNTEKSDNSISKVTVADINANGIKTLFMLDSNKKRIYIQEIMSNGEKGPFKDIPAGSWKINSNFTMDFFESGNTKSMILFDGEKFGIIKSANNFNANRKHLSKVLTHETRIKDGRYIYAIPGTLTGKFDTELVAIEGTKNHMEILGINDDKLTTLLTFKIFEEKQSESTRQSVEPRELKIEDINNDGINDIIALIHDRIIIYTQKNK